MWPEALFALCLDIFIILYQALAFIKWQIWDSKLLHEFLHQSLSKSVVSKMAKVGFLVLLVYMNVLYVWQNEVVLKNIICLLFQNAADQLAKLKLEESELKKQEAEFRKKEEEFKKKERLQPWNIDTLCHDGKDKTVSEFYCQKTSYRDWSNIVDIYSFIVSGDVILELYNLVSHIIWGPCSQSHDFYPAVLLSWLARSDKFIRNWCFMM